MKVVEGLAKDDLLVLTLGFVRSAVPSVQVLHQLQAFGMITRRRDGAKGSLVEEKVLEPAEEKVPDDEAAKEVAPIGRHRSCLPAP